MSAPAPSASDPVHIRPERPQDRALADALIAEAFGPGRFAKAAERLRESNAPDSDLSLMAWEGDEAAGCVRMWPVHIGARPAILLGPFAVASGRRKRGLGAALVDAACLAAAAAGHQVVLLVGDAPFFQRLGFEPVPPGRLRMPGPVSPARVMWAVDGLGGDVRP
jgi:predicted N-acetyltransferase YhbS